MQLRFQSSTCEWIVVKRSKYYQVQSIAAHFFIVANEEAKLLINMDYAIFKCISWKYNVQNYEFQYIDSNEIHAQQSTFISI